MNTQDLLFAINREVINPIVVILFLFAFLLFIYGVLRFVYFMDSDEERATGKRVMVWGVIGMSIMISVFAIVRLILTSLGVPTGNMLF